MNEYKLLKFADLTTDLRRQILDLGMRSGTWLESDRDYYEAQLSNPRNINIVYLNADNMVTGYILGKPHNEAVLDYSTEDSLMIKSERDMVYVDILITDIGRNHVSIGMSLIDRLILEGNKNGVSSFSLHCRVINGFSRIIQHRFKKNIRLIRHIENYVDCNDEAFDYMELENVKRASLA